MLGVLNEYVFLAGHAHVERGGPLDFAWLEDWLAQTPMGLLNKRHGSPERELAALWLDRCRPPAARAGAGQRRSATVLHS